MKKLFTVISQDRKNVAYEMIYKNPNLTRMRLFLTKI